MSPPAQWSTSNSLSGKYLVASRGTMSRDPQTPSRPSGSSGKRHRSESPSQPAKPRLEDMRRDLSKILQTADSFGVKYNLASELQGIVFSYLATIHAYSKDSGKLEKNIQDSEQGKLLRKSFRGFMEKCQKEADYILTLKSLANTYLDQMKPVNPASASKGDSAKNTFDDLLKIINTLQKIRDSKILKNIKKFDSKTTLTSYSPSETRHEAQRLIGEWESSKPKLEIESLLQDWLEKHKNSNNP